MRGSATSAWIGVGILAMVIIFLVIFFMISSTTPRREFTIRDCHAEIYENFWGNYKADLYANITNDGDNKEPNSITVTIRVIYEDGTYNEASTTYPNSVAPGETFSTERLTIDVVDDLTVGHDLDYEVVVFWQGKSWSKTFY